MVFRAAADAVLLLHLAFILFAAGGAPLALRWRWMPLLHLPAAAWAVLVAATGRLCPLTTWENDFRLRAGQSGYTDSFIEHYLLNLIYPAGLTPAIQYALAAAVLALNAALYGWLIARRRGRAAA